MLGLGTLAARFALPAAVKALPWKWIGIGVVGVGLAIGAWRAWAWIDGMQGTIAAQKAEISVKDQEIGGLRVSLAVAVDTANINAAELMAEQLRTQALLDLLARNRRDHQRRESILEEALREIDNWTPGMDGAIGPGLRGTLDGLRRQAPGAAAGDPGAAGLRHGP